MFGSLKTDLKELYVTYKLEIEFGESHNYTKT